MIAALVLAAMAMETPVPPAPPPRFEALSEPPAPDPTAASDTLGFARDNYQRMTVPVRLGGKGPFRFLVDTGSDRSAISRELAAALALGAGPRARMHSATGETRVMLAVMSNLTLSRRSIKRIEAPLLNAADIGADGILGIDALRAERLTFDFVRRTVAITSANDPPAIDERDAIVVRARRRDGRLVITDASAEDQHVSVVVDTGSQYSVGNDAQDRRHDGARPGNRIRRSAHLSPTRPRPPPGDPAGDERAGKFRQSVDRFCRPQTSSCGVARHPRRSALTATVLMQ